ncbi:unnamed protein product, partial [Heterosigma akashiwo]
KDFTFHPEINQKSVLILKKAWGGYSFEEGVSSSVVAYHHRPRHGLMAAKAPPAPLLGASLSASHQMALADRRSAGGGREPGLAEGPLVRWP